MVTVAVATPGHVVVLPTPVIVYTVVEAGTTARVADAIVAEGLVQV
jgi:hypothetical protein